MKKKLALLLVLAMVLLSSAAFAVVRPGDDFYYLDTADVLSTEAEGTIYFCNQLLEEACGAQIVIAALDNLGGADTYDYAYDLFNDWGIGSADENNGFLLLMAIEEDDYYALSGAGVDRIFSSGELDALFEKYLEPDFAKKNYEAGALKFFDAVLDKYADLYNLDISLESGEKLAQAYLAQNRTDTAFEGAHSGGGSYGASAGEYYYEEEDDSAIFWFIILVIVVIIIIPSRHSRGRVRSRGPVIFVGRPHGHHHHAPHHHVPPRPHGGPRPGGAGRASSGVSRSFTSSGRSGGFSGSFGGARGGGGRSFGGGAGRGRR